MLGYWNLAIDEEDVGEYCSLKHASDLRSKHLRFLTFIVG